MSTLTNTDAFPDSVDGEITAFDIIEELGEDLDFMENAAPTSWIAYFTHHAYRIVKADPDGYFYTRSGVEYVKVFENEVIPFVIHMKVGGIDDTIIEKSPFSCGCRREVDSLPAF